MAKMRVYELAREVNVESKEIITFLSSKGIEVKSASSNVDEDGILAVRKGFGSSAASGKPAEKSAEKPKETKENKEKSKPQESAAKQEKSEKQEKSASSGPAKKHNISVVFNSQLSSQQGKKKRQNETAGGQRRGDSGRESDRGVDKRGFKPSAGYTPIKPRPDSERTVRPRERVPEPVPTEAPAPVAEVNKEAPKPQERPAERPQEAPAPAPVKEKVFVELPPEQPKKHNDKKGQAPSKKEKVFVNTGDDKPKGGSDSGKGGKDKRNKQNKPTPENGGKKQERIINLEKAKAKKHVKQGEMKTVVRGEDEILTLVIPEHLTIKELSEKMQVAPSEVVKKLFMKGKMVTVNQDVSYEQAEEIALEFNCICEPEEKVDVIAELLKEEEESTENLVSRPPVVCVMGHVDHGKTSLLDAIRDTRMTEREAGGITQKIGAYTVSINGQKITFLDTPGHEAFTAMRMRGASSTDIAILVVAADDGVMPQTVEAIDHARAAGVEIIVAINKIDKPGANIDRVKKELSEYDLVSEDWGGSTVFVPVSAKNREGIDTLLEMVLLTAEVLELKADPKRKARGLVIEAELDKGRGVVATVLVQKGTLHVGDPVACGRAFGKVRAMTDEHGKRIKKAGPSMPAEILGLSEVPNAGEIFMTLDSEKDARNFANTFISVDKDRMIDESRQKMSLDDLFSQIQAGNLKELNIIVKADVQGSVEAVKNSLEKLSNDEVVVKIIHAGVGAITESDVTLATASNAIIIGFNVRPETNAKQTADAEGIDVRLYSVIYSIIEDIDAAMKGMLEPVYEEKVIGHAVVRQVFSASEIGNIAGSYVTDGEIVRDSKIRISRAGEQIFEGELKSLKRFKDNVKEVKSGFECGLVFDGFDAIEMDDEIEAYIMVEVKRT